MRDCSDNWSVVNNRVTLGEEVSYFCYATLLYKIKYIGEGGKAVANLKSDFQHGA
jgi:hypothetical protein